MENQLHPCQKCGACCSTYRVSFHWSETLEESFHVPKEMTYRSSTHTLAMKNKSPNNFRCSALEGHIGKSVQCGIYENRPSPCRNFKASFEDGTHNPRCDQCRAARGLAPLTLDDWKTNLEEISCAQALPASADL